MFYVTLYLLAIVLANLSVAAFGPSVSVLNAFLFIGLDLTARDALHERWSKQNLVRNMALLIAGGSLLSWFLNRDAGQIALASFVAFAAAAVVDTAVYRLLDGKARWLKINGSNGNQRLVDEAMGTLTATERHALVQVPFLLGYANGDGPAKTAVDPLRTVHTENGQALAQPHGVAVDDCYFRMLQPHEIGRGMAFPETYTVLGNKREQVRQFGNAVTPPVMKQILQRCAAT